MQCSTWKITRHFTTRCAIAVAVAVPMLSGARLRADEKPATAATATPSPDHNVKEENVKRLKVLLGTAMGNRETLQDQSAKKAEEIVTECGLSPENVKPVMLELERERFTLQVTLATKPVHIRILAEKVEAIVDEARNRAESDAVVVGLEKLVAARRKILTELRDRPAGGAASSADVSKSEADLTEAELRLALRREEIAKASGNGDLERLNRELRELTISRELEEVCLRQLDERLQKLRNVLARVRWYDDNSYKIAIISREIERVGQFLLDAEVELPSK